MGNAVEKEVAEEEATEKVGNEGEKVVENDVEELDEVNVEADVEDAETKAEADNDEAPYEE